MALYSFNEKISRNGLPPATIARQFQLHQTAYVETTKSGKKAKSNTTANGVANTLAIRIGSNLFEVRVSPFSKWVIVAMPVTFTLCICFMMWFVKYLNLDEYILQWLLN